MTVRAPSNAPDWAFNLARDIQGEIDIARTMFISRTPFTVAELTAALAALHPWKLAIVSDGATNKFVAVSNGSAFYYMEGTAV